MDGNILPAAQVVCSSGAAVLGGGPEAAYHIAYVSEVAPRLEIANPHAGFPSGHLREGDLSGEVGADEGRFLPGTGEVEWSHHDGAGHAGVGRLAAEHFGAQLAGRVGAARSCCCRFSQWHGALVGSPVYLAARYQDHRGFPVRLGDRVEHCVSPEEVYLQRRSPTLPGVPYMRQRRQVVHGVRTNLCQQL